MGRRLDIKWENIKRTKKINITDKVLVLVNVKENFLQRRSGAKVYSEIKKSLEKLYDLKIINLHELIISKSIQKDIKSLFIKIF